MSTARNPRRPVSPAYYLGRPAELWLVTQRQRKTKPSRHRDIARD